jgi:hypothetical protein
MSRIPLLPSFMHLRRQQVNDLVFVIFGSHQDHLMSADKFNIFVHLSILIGCLSVEISMVVGLSIKVTSATASIRSNVNYS